MISGVYSSFFLPNKQYNINPNKKIKKESSVSNDLQESRGKNQNLSEAEDASNNRCLNKFLTSSNPDINISDIIKDFKATMTQLGIPKSLGKDIIADLKQVHLHASQENPSISNIQSNLYKAAEKVDKFVCETIGEESTVVKQWVDALLYQKINYKAYDPLPTENLKSEKSNSSSDNKPEEQKNTGIQNNFSPAEDNSVHVEIDEKPSNEYNLETSFEINYPQDIIREIEEETIVSGDLPLPAASENDFSSFSKTDINTKEYRSQIQQNFAKARQKVAMGDLEAAEQIYKEISFTSLKLNDNTPLIKSYSNLAKLCDKKLDFKGALSNYHQAIKIASAEKDDQTLATLHFNVASIYDDLNMAPQALKHYYAALAFDGESDNMDGQALTLNNIASVYSNNNSDSEALKCYKLAFSIASQVDDSEAKAHILSNIGSLFKKQNNLENALEYFRRALKLDQDNKNIEGSTKTLINIGEIYNHLDENERAVKYFNKALKQAQSINDTHLLSLAANYINN